MRDQNLCHLVFHEKGRRFIASGIYEQRAIVLQLDHDGDFRFAQKVFSLFPNSLAQINSCFDKYDFGIANNTSLLGSF